MGSCLVGRGLPCLNMVSRLLRISRGALVYEGTLHMVTMSSMRRIAALLGMRSLITPHRSHTRLIESLQILVLGPDSTANAPRGLFENDILTEVLIIGSV